MFIIYFIFLAIDYNWKFETSVEGKISEGLFDTTYM